MAKWLGYKEEAHLDAPMGPKTSKPPDNAQFPQVHKRVSYPARLLLPSRMDAVLFENVDTLKKDSVFNISNQCWWRAY